MKVQVPENVSRIGRVESLDLWSPERDVSTNFEVVGDEPGRRPSRMIVWESVDPCKKPTCQPICCVLLVHTGWSRSELIMIAYSVLVDSSSASGYGRVAGAGVGSSASGRQIKAPVRVTYRWPLGGGAGRRSTTCATRLCGGARSAARSCVRLFGRRRGPGRSGLVVHRQTVLTERLNAWRLLYERWQLRLRFLVILWR